MSQQKSKDKTVSHIKSKSSSQFQERQPSDDYECRLTNQLKAKAGMNQMNFNSNQPQSQGYGSSQFASFQKQSVAKLEELKVNIQFSNGPKSELSLDQIKREAQSIYTALQSKDRDTVSRGKKGKSHTNPNSEGKKGFKIKSKGVETECPSKFSNYENSYLAQNDLLLSSKSTQEETPESMSFIDQIRRKFSEQRYMKREDVLRLLKELQQQEQEKMKQKVFDQQEVFKGFSLNNDNRLFHST